MAKATGRGASAGATRGSDRTSDESSSIDQVLGDLQKVVEALESGDLPLEQALERFELGVKLVRDGTRLLDAVEERVEVLLADRDEPVPFTESEEEPNHDDR